MSTICVKRTAQPAAAAQTIILIAANAATAILIAGGALPMMESASVTAGGPVGPFTLLRCKMFVAAQSGALVRPYTRCRTERTDEIIFFTHRCSVEGHTRAFPA